VREREREREQEQEREREREKERERERKRKGAPCHTAAPGRASPAEHRGWRAQGKAVPAIALDTYFDCTFVIDFLL